MQLLPTEERIRDFGFDENGNRVIEIIVDVINNDTLDTDRLSVGVICEVPESECSSPQMIDPIRPDSEWRELLRVSLPSGNTSATFVVRSLDNVEKGELAQLQIDIPPPQVRRPDLETESAVRGYWSDGTVDLDIVAALRNEGIQRLSPGLRLIKLQCSHNDGAATACGPAGEIALPKEILSDAAEMLVRVPAGKVILTFNHSIGDQNVLTVNVPERIVGVDRQVWGCFIDTSNLGKPRNDQSEGIGCAAWTKEWIVKWRQADPIKLWTQGQDSWMKEFLKVLDGLSQLLNLSFMPAQNEDKADIVAHMGVPHIEGGDRDETCPSGALGCARVKYKLDRRLYYARIRIHEDQPDTDFADLGSFRQRKVRFAMLHESIHALTWMQHRTDPGSVMQESIHSGQGLTPMDEALLRLHAHQLVEPGMTFWEVVNTIIFDDELIDPQRESGLAAWNLLKNVYDGLRQSGGARFTVRSSSAGCNQDFGWASYEVSNILSAFEGSGWIKIQEGSDVRFTLHSDAGATEYWRRSDDFWTQGSPEEAFGRTSGWREDLSDPYLILSWALRLADWDEVELSEDPEGLLVLRLAIELGPTAGYDHIDSANIVLKVDPDTFALIEYEADWSLINQNCDVYLVMAKDGVLTTAFDIPSDILQESTILQACGAEVDDLPGFVETFTHWARQCNPSSVTGRSHGFSHRANFTLTNWSVVTAQVRIESVDRVYIYLVSDSEEVLDQREGDPLWDAWVQKLLPPGSYSIEVVSDRTLTPEGFVLSIITSPVPPPPHRFQYVEAAGRTSCGLLVDGTPVCWGNDWGGKLAAPAGEVFTSLAVGNTATCGLRADGSLVCWGLGSGSIMRERPETGEVFKEISAGSTFICGLREVGTVICWGGFDDDVWAASPVPVDETFTAVNSGRNYACGLRTDGTAACWGWNAYGQAEAPADERFIAISSGDRSSCGLREDGSVLCWGGGREKQSIAPAPPEDERLSSISSVEPACGLRLDGTLVCWRNDRFGSGSPPENEQFISISSSSSHSCGLRPNGTVVCWGWDQFGQSSPPLSAPP